MCVCRFYPVSNLRHFMHKVDMLKVDHYTNMEPIQKATKVSVKFHYVLGQQTKSEYIAGLVRWS